MLTTSPSGKRQGEAAVRYEYQSRTVVLRQSSSLNPSDPFRVGLVDVVLADENGPLVIIECKLWHNPEARRGVVGQILEHARELSRYGYEDLQRQIAIAIARRGDALYDLACEAGGTLEEAAFVERASRDLAAGRFLLVVGDGITEGTKRIGEYLRDQAKLAFDFGLVEIADKLDLGSDYYWLMRIVAVAYAKEVSFSLILDRHWRSTPPSSRYSETEPLFSSMLVNASIRYFSSTPRTRLSIRGSAEAERVLKNFFSKLALSGPLFNASFDLR